ncbi:MULTISPECIES: sensor histidine kinase [Kitasatospora]
MSTTVPRGRETATAPPDGADTGADSARVAEARRRSTERRRRQAARMHQLLWVVVVVTAAFACQDPPRPGLTGVRLAVTVALAGCLVALVLAACERGPRNSEAGLVALPLLLGVSGTVLAALQPASLMVIPVSAAVGMLFSRVRARLALWLATPLTVSVSLMTGGITSAHVSVQTGLGSALLCVVLGASCFFARQAGLGQDRTELLLAELEDSREAVARAAAVAERSRIARELHDVLAQSLSALAVQLEGARKLAERDRVDPVLRRLIVRSGELTREGLSDARQAVAALRGDDLPTVGRLNALVERCRRDLAMPISLSVSGQPQRALTAEENLALYRGAQEALTNAARYAAGAPTAVVLRYTPRATVLTVSDQGATATATTGGSGAGAASGPGTPPADAWTGGGNGLRGMRERIERVRGRTHAGPTAQGWTVKMEIPV